MAKYEYSDIVAEMYDYSPFFSKFICQNSAVVDFYISEAKNNKKILEFGSATGIFTIPLAQSGHIIDAVEMSDDMIKIIKRKIEDKNIKNINIRKQNALCFSAIEEYDMVILPDSLLLAVGSKIEQEELLKISNKALKKGGKIIIDFFPPNYKLFDGEIKRSYAKAKDCNGNLYLIEREECWDSIQQISELKYIHKMIDCNFNIIKKYESIIKYNFLYLSEVIMYLENLHFKIDKCIGELCKYYNNYIITATKTSELTY
ncbi:MAG: class I SAM-dependent methyltransferase [Lachnospiraceae bacterium]|nr:class I SAM-dependent methyltransferase [Lachnospiraceae bacterium]